MSFSTSGVILTSFNNLVENVVMKKFTTDVSSESENFVAKDLEYQLIILYVQKRVRRKMDNGILFSMKVFLHLAYI